MTWSMCVLSTRVVLRPNRVLTAVLRLRFPAFIYYDDV